jgi:hypothetical protein
MISIKKYILIGLFGVLAISSVIMTVVSATSGAEISKLQKEEAKLTDEKRYLENMLVKTLSMSQLQEKSGSLGFGKPVNIVYVTQPEAVAKLP